MAPLDHLLRLTDDCGVWQHARHAVPDRRHGYCLDDVARALWLCARRCRLDPGDAEAGRLAAIYASFVDHAWDGEAARFRNFMTSDRRWIEEEDEDASARAILALVETVHAPLPAGIGDWARDVLRDALPIVGRLRSPRPWAWALGALAMADDLDLPSEPLGRDLAARMWTLWQGAPGPSFETFLAYDSPRLAQGALDGARWVPELFDAGLSSLNWMAEMQTGARGQFRPPGSEGYGQTGKPARYAQQPLDAWAHVEASLAAFARSDDRFWLDEARRAHAWFLGDNDAGVPMATPQGGCHDGIDLGGVNRNQGAESTLAWLHADAAMQGVPRQMGDRPD